jgi:hypothetical protein
MHQKTDYLFVECFLMQGPTAAFNTKIILIEKSKLSFKFAIHAPEEEQVL